MKVIVKSMFGGYPFLIPSGRRDGAGQFVIMFNISSNIRFIFVNGAPKIFFSLVNLSKNFIYEFHGRQTMFSENHMIFLLLIGHTHIGSYIHFLSEHNIQYIFCYYIIIK